MWSVKDFKIKKIERLIDKRLTDVRGEGGGELGGKGEGLTTNW